MHDMGLYRQGVLPVQKAGEDAGEALGCRQSLLAGGFGSTVITVHLHKDWRVAEREHGVKESEKSKLG